MKRRNIVSIFLAGVFSISFAQAQEILTLQQVLKFALENKAEAKKAALDLENAEYQIDEVRGGALPQITANASIKHNIIIPEMAFDMGGQSITAKMGRPWNSAALVSLNQQLFNQALFTGLKAAKTTREFYLVNAQLTEEQLIEKVSNAYYDIFQTQLQLETIQNNLDNTTKTKNVVKGLVDAGLAKKIDYDRLVVAVNNLEAQKQQVSIAIELKENALKFAIGMPIDRDIALPEGIFDVDPTIALEPINVESRTEVQLFNKQIELYELNKKSKVADLYPKLSLGADFGWSGFGNGFPIGGDFMWPKTSSVGLNLSIPIFTGGATKSRINQADVQIRQAKVELEDAKLGLSMANQNAIAQIKNSLLTVNTNRGNVALAKEVLSDTENNYKYGLATLTELLDAENAYADAQNNLNTSLLSFKVAEVQLLKSKGELKNKLVNEEK